MVLLLFEDLDWLLGFMFVGLIVVNILGSSLVFLSCRDGFFVSLCFGMKILFIHNKKNIYIYIYKIFNSLKFDGHRSLILEPDTASVL
jgi:hypothetical protein